MHLRSSFDFQFTNAGTNQSYGCNDYMPKLFTKYLEEVLLKDDDNDDTEEIASLGLAASNEEVKMPSKPMPSLQKKQSSGIWNRFFGGKNVKVDDEMVAQLVEMGYEAKQAKKALQKTNNDLHQALDDLSKEDITGLEQIPSYSMQLDDTKNALIKMMVYVCRNIEESNKKCIICQ